MRRASVPGAFLGLPGFLGMLGLFGPGLLMLAHAAAAQPVPGSGMPAIFGPPGYAGGGAPGQGAPGQGAPGQGAAGPGQAAIDPYSARPGVTAPDAPLYDPVTGLPTQARVIARGRAGSALLPPPASADPFGNQSIPGVPSRTGLPGTAPPVDPFTAQPGVQQMRTGTYDTTRTGPARSGPTPSPYGAAPGTGTLPGYPGTASPGYPGGALPGFGGGYGAAPRPVDPYTGSPTDKYSYGRR